MAPGTERCVLIRMESHELTLAPMWKNTEVTRRLKLDAPIVQGPFGSGLSAVDLVVAVSEGGGLGSFGVHHLDGAGIRAIDAQIRARTRRALRAEPVDSARRQRRSADDATSSGSAACELLRPYFDELARAAAGAARALRASLPGADRDAARTAAAGVQLRVRRAVAGRARALPQRRHRHARRRDHGGRSQTTGRCGRRHDRRLRIRGGRASRLVPARARGLPDRARWR